MAVAAGDCFRLNIRGQVSSGDGSLWNRRTGLIEDTAGYRGVVDRLLSAEVWRAEAREECGRKYETAKHGVSWNGTSPRWIARGAVRRIVSERAFAGCGEAQTVRRTAGGPRVWRERSREMRRWVSAEAVAEVSVAGSLISGCAVRSAANFRPATVAGGCGKLGQRALSVGELLSSAMPIVVQ